MSKNFKVNMEIDLFGIKLKSPFIVGSGPISYGAEGIIRAYKKGAGAVVTKTIRDVAANNPYPHISRCGKGSLINAEKWTDYPAERWIEREIPEAKEAGVVVIGSIGHTPEEVEHWVQPVVSAGADCIELVSYTEETMLPMVEIARQKVDTPILVKISPNWPDPVGSALKAVKLGADGITATDSLGPVLRVDIRTAKPYLGSENGFGWLTGEALRPRTQAIVAEIAKKTKVPVIGLGGVITAEDAIEMMMVGSSAVGICTTLIINGVEYIETLIAKTESLIAELGFSSVEEISGLALNHLPGKENLNRFIFEFDEVRCIDCQKCVRVCSYQARLLEDKKMILDEDLCRYCGFCSSICPVRALTITEDKEVVR